MVTNRSKVVNRSYFGFFFRRDLEGETPFSFLTGFAALFFTTTFTFFFGGSGFGVFLGRTFLLCDTFAAFDTFDGVFFTFALDFTTLIGFFGLLATDFPDRGFFAGFFIGFAGNFFGTGLGAGFVVEASLTVSLETLGLLVGISVLVPLPLFS